MTGVGEAELPSPILSPSGFERAAFLAREAIHYGSSDRLPKECADYLMRVLLAELTAVRDETDGVVYAVKRLVGDGGGKLSSAKEVARALGYSEDYLSRILRKACGVGLKQYIDGVRIDAIKRELLTEDMRLSEVALSFGFSEYKAFLKFFKYHEGITPTEFIRSYHG